MLVHCCVCVQLKEFISDFFTFNKYSSSVNFVISVLPKVCFILSFRAFHGDECVGGCRYYFGCDVRPVCHLSVKRVNG